MYKYLCIKLISNQLSFKGNTVKAHLKKKKDKKTEACFEWMNEDTSDT